MKNDNIVALSTAYGASGVAVIRLSGDSPLKIAEKMFHPQGNIKVEDFIPYMMYTGEFDCKVFKDYGMCVYFKAPKSYTGEDVVEFHTHGGIAIVKGVLRRAVELGARIAERGEFTKRAFLNGKLSLSSAEGLIDMINSETEAEVKAGYGLYREKLKKQIDDIQDGLTYALAQIDADIDFPEEDLEATSREEIRTTLKNSLARLTAMLSTYRTGRTLKSGVKVAIVGKPNSGKSSVLNRFLNYDKAIVSDVAGTTRDIVEGSIDEQGVRFNFYDTAGIRDTGDAIEEIGIGLAKRTLAGADIVLFIVDSADVTTEDLEIYNLIKDKPHITVMNKSDKAVYNGDLPVDISVSAKTGDNIEDLKRLLFTTTFGMNFDLSGDFLTEERHYNAIKGATEKLSIALENLDFNTLDLIAIDIRQAWDLLGEISGKSATEDVIDEIFKKFCVGK